MAERLVADACSEGKTANAADAATTADAATAADAAVQCLPLYSALMAIGNPRVDYFSLDVDGPELQVSMFIQLFLTSELTLRANKLTLQLLTINVMRLFHPLNSLLIIMMVITVEWE